MSIKILKIVVITFLLLMVIFVIRFLFVGSYYGHKFKWGAQNKIDWLLKDSIRSKISPIGGVARGRTDNIYVVNLKDDSGTMLSIWEIESNIPFKAISIDTNYSSDLIELETFESINVESEDILYNIEYGSNFTKDFILGLDDFSKIKARYSGENYIGVFGEDIMDFYVESDDKTNVLLQNNFKMPYLAILIYKKNEKIYLIMLSANKEFDGNIIDVLDLK